ncbi:hypothetical protein VB005_02395 [Metarhizium brunneum]
MPLASLGIAPLAATGPWQLEARGSVSVAVAGRWKAENGQPVPRKPQRKPAAFEKTEVYILFHYSSPAEFTMPSFVVAVKATARASSSCSRRPPGFRTGPTAALRPPHFIRPAPE